MKVSDSLPIRLVFLCNAPAVPAGVEKTALLLYQHLDKERFDVRFILNGEGAFFGQLADAGADVEVIPCGRRVSFGWQKQLRRSLRQRPADVVQLHLSRLNAWWLRRFFPDTKSVERLNMTRHGYGGYPLRWKWLDCCTARWIDHFVVVSESLKQQFVSRGYPPEKMTVVYNGVSVSGGIPSSGLREELGIEADMPLIGTVGRLTEQKGMDVFLKAAAHIAEALPEARFVIAGEGELRSRLEAMARDLGLQENVLFLGYRQDVLNVIAGLDVMLYLSRWEPFANTLLEAMAVGSPVVATDVGGNREAVVDRESGCLVPPENAKAASDAVLEIIRNNAFHEYLRRNAAERVEHFSVEEMARGHEKVYRNLVSRQAVRE